MFPFSHKQKPLNKDPLYPLSALVKERIPTQRAQAFGGSPHSASKAKKRKSFTMNRHESWSEEEAGGWQTTSSVDERLPLTRDNNKANDSGALTSSSTPTRQHRRIQSLNTPTRRATNNAANRRRHHSTLDELFASIGKSLGTIAEDVKGEASFVRDVFAHELEAADKGKKFFLNVTMSRNMSVLPEQLSQMMDEVTGRFSQDMQEEASKQEALLPTTSTTPEKVAPTVGTLP